jgi:uncharacterized protein YecE (DUF72 family)
MAGRVYIGVSGFSYAGWRGGFYPTDLSPRRHLAYAASRFNSIEVNGSFYSLQRPSTYGRWYDETPAGFLFAVKGSRFITHNKKLRDVDAALANFFASGVLRLEDKLGPILWQLSPTLRFEEERLAQFLDRLPRDTGAAAELARHHDHRLKAPAWTSITRIRRLRHAIEPRHASWFVPEMIELLRRSGVAVVMSDSANWERIEDVTADFVYLRLHGSVATYASRYSDAELDGWAERIRHWVRGLQPPDARLAAPGSRARRRAARDIFVYFDNDQKANAPQDALRLMQRLGVQQSGVRAA